MSRNVELESAIKYTISNPTRYNGFLRVAANNFRLSTANQLFVYYQKEDADIVLDAGRWEKLFGRIVADNAQKIRILRNLSTRFCKCLNMAVKLLSNIPIGQQLGISQTRRK